MKPPRPGIQRAMRKIAKPSLTWTERSLLRLRPEEAYVTGMILYALVLDKKDAGEFTLFQGFSVNALPEFAPLRQICQLPAHSNELFKDRSETARSRMSGISAYSIVLIEDEFFEQLEAHPGFVCVISNEATHERVAGYLAERGNTRWLHVTTSEAETAEPKLWDVDRASIYAWTKSFVVEHLNKRRDAFPHASEFRPFVEWDDATVPIPSRNHNVLTPTETVFLSLGYSIELPDDTLNGNDDSVFADALVAASQSLETTLHQLTGYSKRPPGVPSLIITVPSVFRHLKPNQLRREATPELRRVTRAVLRQAQYIALRATAKEQEEMARSQLSNVILGMRAQELHLYTAALTVIACGLCCPVLRLPPQLDRVRTLLVGLATLSRKGNDAQRRRNQLAIRIGEMFRSLIPAQLLTNLDRYVNQGVKLVGDVPLELLPINGLPLSLRCSVSRLPTLQGICWFGIRSCALPLFCGHLTSTMF